MTPIHNKFDLFFLHMFSKPWLSGRGHCRKLRMIMQLFSSKNAHLATQDSILRKNQDASNYDLNSANKTQRRHLFFRCKKEERGVQWKRSWSKSFDLNTSKQRVVIVATH